GGSGGGGPTVQDPPGHSMTAMRAKPCGASVTGKEAAAAPGRAFALPSERRDPAIGNASAMRNRTPISPSLLRSVFRGARSAVVRGLLSAACCAGLAGSAAAQVDVFPSSVDIRLLQGPNPDQLRIQL